MIPGLPGPEKLQIALFKIPMVPKTGVGQDLMSCQMLMQKMLQVFWPVLPFENLYINIRTNLSITDQYSFMYAALYRIVNEPNQLIIKP